MPKNEYPKCLYHATLPAVLVADETEHAKFQDGWFESPGEAAAYKPEPIAAEVVDSPQPIAPEPPRTKKQKR